MKFVSLVLVRDANSSFESAKRIATTGQKIAKKVLQLDSSEKQVSN